MPGPGWPSASRSSTFQPTSSDWNAVADAPHNWPGDVNGGGNQLLAVSNINGTGSLTMTSQPRVLAYNSANQSISDSTWTSLSFNTEAGFAAGGIHSTSVNPTRFTIPQAGWYVAIAQVSFASNSTGRRYIRVLLNGTTVLLTHISAAISGDVSTVSVTWPDGYAVGNYLEFQVWQNSGGALNAVSGFASTFGSVMQLS